MKNFTLVIVMMVMIISPSFAQGIENDNMVLYSKANVLFESGRYDEAVRMYNRVLGNDENHTGALFMRAKAKFELGAYRGTKNDVLVFVDKAGTTKELVKLMAQTEMRLNNNKAAKNYLKTALELDPYDAEMHLLSGDIAIDQSNRNLACESYASAASLGNQRAMTRMNDYCGGPEAQVKSAGEEQEMETSSETINEPEDEITAEEDGGIISLEDIVNEVEDEVPTISNPAPDRNASKEIEIDDKLTVSLTNGIGHRDVSYRPSIFMLSDQDGTVVIDLCINSNGTVTDAVFNRDDSTIFRSSLTSLALRKAKAFQFSESSGREDCGVMVFYIKS